MRLLCIVYTSLQEIFVSAHCHCWEGLFSVGGNGGDGGGGAAAAADDDDDDVFCCCSSSYLILCKTYYLSRDSVYVNLSNVT
jgi:hypothetical protein